MKKEKYIWFPVVTAVSVSRIMVIPVLTAQSEFLHCVSDLHSIFTGLLPHASPNNMQSIDYYILMIIFLLEYVDTILSVSQNNPQLRICYYSTVRV